MLFKEETIEDTHFFEPLFGLGDFEPKMLKWDSKCCLVDVSFYHLSWRIKQTWVLDCPKDDDDDDLESQEVHQ
jgi:hypothetical protein